MSRPLYHCGPAGLRWSTKRKEFTESQNSRGWKENLQQMFVEAKAS